MLLLKFKAFPQRNETVTKQFENSFETLFFSQNKTQKRRKTF